MFLKLSLLTLYNTSLPYFATNSFPVLSTISPAPFGKVTPYSCSNLFISFRKTYLLIIDDTATDKHSSSALVRKVTLLIFLGASFI